MAYPTPSDLASFLKQDVDTSTAALVIAKTIALFEARAQSHWGGTLALTYAKPGDGRTEWVIPYAPLVAVSAVRVAGVTLTVGSDYVVIEQSVFRRMGFGLPWRYPPDLVEFDITYGYASVGDDVAGAVLESAGASYMAPDITTAQEAIDDYSVKSTPGLGGMRLSPAAAELADWYRGVLVA